VWLANRTGRIKRLSPSAGSNKEEEASMMARIGLSAAILFGLLVTDAGVCAQNEHRAGPGEVTWSWETAVMEVDLERICVSEHAVKLWRRGDRWRREYSGRGEDGGYGVLFDGVGRYVYCRWGAGREAWFHLGRDGGTHVPEAADGARERGRGALPPTAVGSAMGALLLGLVGELGPVGDAEDAAGLAGFTKAGEEEILGCRCEVYESAADRHQPRGAETVAGDASRLWITIAELGGTRWIVQSVRRLGDKLTVARLRGPVRPDSEHGDSFFRVPPGAEVLDSGNLDKLLAQARQKTPARDGHDGE